MHGDAATPVVGAENVTTRGVNRVVARRASCGLQIQEGEVAGAGIDGKGADGAATIVGVGLGVGVQVPPRGMQSQVRWRIFAFRPAENPQGARGGVDFAMVDGGVLALRVVADVDEQSVSHGAGMLL